ncbi:AAA family ATPase [Aeromonas bivalvium]|uniref:AAA family ATPase n=1 Tax=Aeromonas bivalvium TaxID=440079 RepID=UPI0038D142AE
MARLKNLEIKGFKSILDQSIDLGQLNIFIGTNGAGKSNILEAIAMLSASLEGQVDYDRLARRGARLSSPEIFKSSFRNKDRRATISLSACGHNSSYSANILASDSFNFHSESLYIGGKRVAGRSGNGSTILGKSAQRIPPGSSISSLYDLFNGLPKEMDSLKDFAIYSPATPILRGSAPDTSNKTPLGLYGGRMAEALNEYLTDTNKKDIQRFFRLLDWFQLVGSTESINQKLLSEHVSLGKKVIYFKDKFMKVNFNQIYSYDVSEGALFTLFVLLLLCHKSSPNIFALDNVDSALNPGLVRELMMHVTEILKNKPEKQMFLTTHNPTTLDAIDLFNPEHRLFVVQRETDGVTVVKRIEPPKGFTKEDWTEKYYGMKLSELWLAGVFGALPVGY